MKKIPIYFLLGIILLFQSCSNTTFKGSKRCPAAIHANDKILVLNLPFDNDQTPFSAMKKEFGKKNIKVFYVGNESSTLKAAGVNNPTDANAQKKMLAQGYRYLLYIKGVHRSNPNNNPTNGSNTAKGDEVSISVIDFSLHSIEQNKVIFTSRVKTKVAPVYGPHKSGEEPNVTFSTTESATTIAMRKIAKKLMKVCK